MRPEERGDLVWVLDDLTDEQVDRVLSDVERELEDRARMRRARVVEVEIGGEVVPVKVYPPADVSGEDPMLRRVTAWPRDESS